MNLLRPTLTPMRAWLLALLLLAAQAVGLAHRLQHGQLAGGLAQAVAAAVSDDSARAFADHQAGGTDCRLLDHLMHADALCVDVTPAVLPATPQRSGPPAAVNGAPVAAPALYRARAPPQA